MERRRRLAGYALAVVLAPLFTVSLALLHGQLSPVADVLAFVIALIAVIAVIAVAEAMRRAGQAAAAIAAAEPTAEADRMRTALLAAVSHDLRTPLAAAQAAVSCLRCRDIQLTAGDHSELLATADESLDLLTRLVVSLLDVG